jgi:hypothetical protein
MVIERSTVEYATPDMARAILYGQPLVADHHMDMFQLGRVLMWMCVAEGRMWPNLPPCASERDKLLFLASSEEFDLSDIRNTHLRYMVAHLLRKDPNRRLSLEALLPLL